MQNDGAILIKNKDGQFKTVGLEVHRPVIDRQQPVENIKTERKIESNLVVEKRIKEVNEKINKETVKKIEKKDNLPKPIAPEISAPAFYINLEDEQEVEKLRDKEKFNKQQERKNNLANTVEKIIKISGLVVNQEIKNRLYKIIESNLRGIRNLINTKEALIRPVNLGGAGLDDRQAQLILDAIKKFTGNNKLQTEQNGLDEKLDKKLKQEKNKDDEVKENQEKFGVSDLIKKEQELNQAVDLPELNSVGNKKIKRQEEVPVVQDIKEIKKEKVENDLSKNLQEMTHNKTELDLKEQEEKVEQPIMRHERRVYGPVEELASYNLQSFRALGNTPQDILKKIQDKLLLLQDESFEKRAEGITAWRNSEVYKIYLSLGQESMEKQKSVKELIVFKQDNNQPTLTLEEFEAISDFNQDLNA